LIPIITIFLLSSIVWLIIGISRKNEITLIVLNLYWWIGSFVSAHFVWLVWQSRNYSENWAMIGFIFCSLPYLITTVFMINVKLFYIRKWKSKKGKAIQLASVGLLFFLIFQIIVGFISG
ncbi:hypothetical protein QUF70_15975, partial [Desulfobacterales bacterium HSG17]|nr:hypothetical protein [Desulfobacterales bacterium HSG17]